MPYIFLIGVLDQEKIKNTKLSQILLEVLREGGVVGGGFDPLITEETETVYDSETFEHPRRPGPLFCMLC